jgi:hypothetical protein
LVVEELVDAPLVEPLAVFIDEAVGSELPNDDSRRVALGEALEDAPNDCTLSGSDAYYFPLSASLIPPTAF